MPLPKISSTPTLLTCPLNPVLGPITVHEEQERLRRKNETAAELQRMREHAQDKTLEDRGMLLDTASYLALRQARTGVADMATNPAVVDKLNRANMAMARTRRMFWRGQANNTAVRKEWNGKSLNALGAVRAMPVRSRIEGSTMAAKLIGIGSCGEHEAMTTAFLAADLKPGESALGIAHPKKDHAYAVLSDDDAALPDVIADAWCEGPAVLPDDSRYVASAKSGKHEVLEKFAKATDKGAKEVAFVFDSAKGRIEEFVNQYLKTAKTVYSQRSCRDTTPTLTDSMETLRKEIAKEKEPFTIYRQLLDMNLPAGPSTFRQAERIAKRLRDEISFIPELGPLKSIPADWVRAKPTRS